MHIDVRDSIDLTRGIATSTTNSDSLRGAEYWDPVSDTYKDKRTNESVSDETKLEQGDGTTVPVSHKIGSNEEPDSTSSFESGFGEYWDPVTDTYRSKRTNESVPDEIIQGKSAPAGYETDSSVESDSASSIDSDVGEYWDPVTDSYKSKKTNENAPNKIELGGNPAPSFDFSLGKYWDPAVDSYGNKLELSKDAETWTPTSELEISKGIKGNEQKDESPWEYQAKSAVHCGPANTD